MSEEYENIAGGMSYRTMNGINFTHLSHYLDGFDETSKLDILEKNKEYYIASANKTIKRLELAKTRVLTSKLSFKKSADIDEKISEALKWLDGLKKEILNINKKDLLEKQEYKRWHQVKLLPSTVEGLLITELIFNQIQQIEDQNESLNDSLEEVKKHDKEARSIFLRLMDIDEHSDLKNAEELRLKGYNEAVLADSKLRKYLKK